MRRISVCVAVAFALAVQPAMGGTPPSGIAIGSAQIGVPGSYSVAVTLIGTVPIHGANQLATASFRASMVGNPPFPINGNISTASLTGKTVLGAAFADSCSGDGGSEGSADGGFTITSLFVPGSAIEEYEVTALCSGTTGPILVELTVDSLQPQAIGTYAAQSS